MFLGAASAEAQETGYINPRAFLQLNQPEIAAQYKMQVSPEELEIARQARMVIQNSRGSSRAQAELTKLSGQIQSSVLSVENNRLRGANAETLQGQLSGAAGAFGQAVAYGARYFIPQVNIKRGEGKLDWLQRDDKGTYAQEYDPTTGKKIGEPIPIEQAISIVQLGAASQHPIGGSGGAGKWPTGFDPNTQNTQIPTSLPLDASQQEVCNRKESAKVRQLTRHHNHAG